MPPIAQNVNAFIGAAVLGVIGAAGLFLVEHFRQEKNRHRMAKDLARMDQELSQVKKELHDLLSKQNKEKQVQNRRSMKKNSRKANSIVSATTDDYMSASNYDSSDLEFYDVSDDEELVENGSLILDQILTDIDKKLDLGSINDINETLTKLEDLCIEYPENADLLYRIGKAHHKLSESTDDKEIIQVHIARGIIACSKAIEIDPYNAEVHKWYAILIGSRSDFQPLQQKISDGHLFKKHVDIAVSINPNDASLHHMLGRFSYEIAELKWYERKVAAAFFGEPPNATYAEALEHFFKAEELGNFEWKENKLSIAKCKIGEGEYAEAIDWLVKANKCKQGDGLDDKIDSEIRALLEKYNSYR